MHKRFLVLVLLLLLCLQQSYCGYVRRTGASYDSHAEKLKVDSIRRLEPIHKANSIGDVLNCAKKGAFIGANIGSVVGQKSTGQALGACVAGIMCPNNAN